MNPARRGALLFGAFSAAVFLAVYLLPAAWWPWLGLGALVPAGIFLWRRMTAGVLLCLGAAAALLWCGCFRAVLFAPAEALDGRRTQVTAVLIEEATAAPFDALAPCWVLQAGKLPVKATLYADETLLDLAPGDRVTAVCDCSKTALLEETRLTDQVTRGIFLELIVRGPVEVRRGSGTPWWCLPRWWGQKLARSIGAALPGDVSGFLTALVTGDKAGLDPGVKTDMARAGISHLMAVSGMHICFLVSLLTFFTGYDPRRRALVCLPVLAFFALAVGATPSVLRACLFQLSFMLAQLLGREEDRWTTLLGALALLLLLDPFSAANIGLQLSFGAVAGIGLVTPRVFARLRRLHFRGTGPVVRRVDLLLTRLWQILAASLGAMVFTVPLSAYYFGTFSILATVTNLLVLPVALVLFVATLLVGLVGMVLPGLAAALGAAVALLGRYVLWVVRTLAAIPYCAVTLQSPCYLAALAGLYGQGLIALLWRSQRRRAWVFLLFAAVAVAGSLWFTRRSFFAHDFTAAVLDVGQGQSVLLTDHGETALVDCGGDSRTDPGDVCADYLGDRGEKRLDKLILTHYHDDHSNGLDALFRRLEVGEVILPKMDRDEETQLHILALARADGAKVTWLDRDETVPLGNAQLRVFAPLGTGGANEEGLSLAVRAGDFQMLITGDMNAVVEERLVNHADLGRCQVLVAGHHGSRYATGEPLLDAIHPETAIISVGENTYGHPDQTTLDRLARYGAEVYRTDCRGTVTITADYTER